MEKINEGETLKLNLLQEIQNANLLSSIEYSNINALDHQKVVGALKSLEMVNKVILIQKEKKYYNISEEGLDIIINGSPENALMRYLIDATRAGNTVKPNELKDKVSKEASSKGLANAKNLKIIIMDKGVIKINPEINFNPDEDKVREHLLAIQVDSSNLSVLDEKTIAFLAHKDRKLIKLDSIKYFDATKGEAFSLDLSKPEADLTTDLIAEGKYITKSFKKYNYNAKGVEINNGSLHPLLRVRTQFREIMLELGFQEMPTNNFVESSFWNFDSLFQPQQHPARDAHDTFFLTKPKYSEKLKDQYPEYFDNVKRVHEKGGYGSLGWRYNFSDEETLKNILRTHTTAVSSRMLFKLAEEYKKTGVFTPKKFFSIDRVFRNETLDSTHLCEFHQVEGVVADYNLGLGHLIATIEDFFLKFGIKKLRFKPAYNPYTEPSMEIFSYHDKLKKWVEIGNSGIFRPEMLAPMGLPENVSVIAWGLSLERPTMIHYKYASIKELFGEEVQLRNTKNAKVYCINL